MHSEFASAGTLRVGLIADTHMPGTIATLWPQVYDAFRGTDLILHAGDLHVADVIDELETLAPTFVCCGNGDLDFQSQVGQHRQSCRKKCSRRLVSTIRKL